ncbi:response regulator [Geodermatophilus nigrescens]
MLPHRPLGSTSAERVIRVLVVDDHALIRAGVIDILEGTADMHPVGAAADGHEAFGLAIDTQPDVVLMDVAMPDLSGIEATRRLVADEIATRILVHSADTSPDLVAAARAAGAAGYLLKRGRSAPLLDAIRVVHAGGAIWPDGDQAAGTTPAP